MRLFCTGKLDLVARVSRPLNNDMMTLTKSVKDVFEALEKNREPTLQLVVPSYYLHQQKLQSVANECRTVALFRAKLRKFLDEKYWTSIKALHWIACFLDPTFKSLHFIPQAKREDVKFKRELINDLDGWILEEMRTVEDKLSAETATTSQDRLAKTFVYEFLHSYQHVGKCETILKQS